jgi:Lipocalin-like domain
MTKSPPLAAALFAGLLASTPAWADPAPQLAGAWVLVAADVVHPDGTRAHDYGEAPKGLLMVDPDGRYSLQIFRSERPKFASGDRAKGTPAEYEAAVLGSSTHFGTLTVDPAAHTLVFKVEAASFPNQDGTVQKRSYELKGDELSYRVAPRPNGDVPISVWRRVR